MKFLADENIPKASVGYLQELGYDIISVADEHSGLSDIQVLDLAKQETRTIITHDRDFGRLIFRNQKRPAGGVVYLREYPVDPLESGKVLHRIVKSKKISFEFKLTVVSSTNIRQRSY